MDGPSSRKRSRRSAGGLATSSSRRQRQRRDELLALVGLEPGAYRDRYPAQLSGGERQRVGVARALAADPPVMLMDEPFGAVDPIVRERLQNEFLRLQEELAKTILFVTHDIDEAIKMGDLVAVMQLGGMLAQFGPPDEILAHPASDFVARFVGADRALKRLSLNRVGELPLEPAVTVTPGDDTELARERVRSAPFPYLLVVDADRRPLGWLPADRIAAQGHIDRRNFSAHAFAFADKERQSLDERLDKAEAALLALTPPIGRGKRQIREGRDLQSRGEAVLKKYRVQGLLTVEAIGAALRPESNPAVLAPSAAAAAS